MGHLSALWSSIIFGTFEELVNFFSWLKQKYLIITFYHVIGSDHPPLVASSACIYEKPLSPWPCCRLLYLVDFQYNSYSPLHSAVGGTDLPILGSSFHLSWEVLFICPELVSHCCLGLMCENGFVFLLKPGKLKENAKDFFAFRLTSLTQQLSQQKNYMLYLNPYSHPGDSKKNNNSVLWSHSWPLPPFLHFYLFAHHWVWA